MSEANHGNSRASECERTCVVNSVGKHGNYERIERAYYPTPPWVIGALAKHLELAGATVWECASGTGAWSRH